jgi:hypothetical protein
MAITRSPDQVKPAAAHVGPRPSVVLDPWPTR